MKAKSIKGKSPEIIQSALQECMADGFKPTLAITFLSDKQHVDTVRSILDEANIQVFGVTTVGEFIEDSVDNETIVILLLDINPEDFIIGIKDSDASSIEQAAKSLAEKGLAIFPNPAFIISGSHVGAPGDSMLKGIIDIAGADANVIGGIASSDSLEVSGFVFTNDHISEQGMICLCINQDNILVRGLAVSGWKPMGTSKTVTKSEGNHLFTIDDEPALDVFLKYTGLKIDLENKEDIFFFVESNYPFQVQRKIGSPVMNPPLMINNADGSLFCGMNIPQGSKIKFSMPPDFEVIDDVIASSEKIKIDSAPDADAMIIFSCIGRLHAFGPLVYEENRGLQNVWDVPMAGFFSFGEFGKPVGGKSEFHGTTCSWVVLKEK
jgi:hypothetical protein